MKNICKKSPHAKIICIISGIVLGLFCVLNIVWVLYHHAVYGKYERITYDINMPHAKISRRDGLSFSISKTKYLSFAGNLGISTQDDKNLIIWLKLQDDFTYGFMVVYNNFVYNFYIDEKGTCLNRDEFSREGQSVFDETQSDAKRLLDQFRAWTDAATKRDFSFFDIDTR